MSVLNSEALIQIENKIIGWKQNNYAPHGYPMSEVTDLLDTIIALKTNKKKWQRLAEHRGQAIADIFSRASRAIERMD